MTTSARPTIPASSGIQGKSANGSAGQSVSAYTRPHRRFNPLTGQWVLVSPQRTQRPWQGRNEAPAGGARAQHDPGCYLCPGNKRAGGQENPPYTATFVF